MVTRFLSPHTFQSVAFVFQNARISRANQGHSSTFVVLWRGYRNQCKAWKQLLIQKMPWRYPVANDDFSRIPGSPIAYWVSTLMRESVSDRQTAGRIGFTAKRTDHRRQRSIPRRWYEVVLPDRIRVRSTSRQDAEHPTKKWFPYNKGGEFRKWYGNYEHCCQLGERWRGDY